MRPSARWLLVPFRLGGRAVVATGRAGVGTLRSFRFWLILILAIIAALIVYYVDADRNTPLTTDGYLQAYVVRVAPQVAGRVVKVHVGESSVVREGDVLFELDHRPFEHKVAMAEARLVTARREVRQLSTQLAAEEAEHRRLEAEADLSRYIDEKDREIFKGGATTERKAVSSSTTHRANRAAVDRSAQLILHIREAIEARVGPENSIVALAEAQLAEAKLNLEYSTIYAPSDGVITNLQLREGDYAHLGESVLSCIDRTQWLVIANYRERSLERLAPGQPALVTFRGQPGVVHPARIMALGLGVLQGQGLPSGNLPDVQLLKSWVPPSQRFQVRLTLDHPEELPLRVGMTCVVSAYPDPDERRRRLNPLTRLVHKVVSLWYYF